MRLFPARCFLESTLDDLPHNLQTHALHQCLLHHAIRDQVMIFLLLFEKQNAMIEEMIALYDNGTWDLVSRLAGKKAIGYTFSLVAKLTSIRLFLSMVATHNWPLHQLDIKNAFSARYDLQEEVYIEQPPRFVT
ncbi:Cysteine-rich RLK (RECEPTOR-like protein kinase) 8 [Cucumis melo var. makuwa]|uniref:Cysteine-rich RLK (RECEPTOR-like protein kinase) 8 n=1 Tax=Cucumis melo var. makuwa TaxID=1194695 RepID=A0A5A7TY90_CUCMM|nr:Cysteine-rich RLK (RECEPTOR-like protein kinase) 8 [Cucumis melo var. makuwa]TYK08078.1 Cysteine-rich RLK (RECEPTOR-like protein kinase) 8 [Cucumis melo var. makuwa]